MPHSKQQRERPAEWADTFASALIYFGNNNSEPSRTDRGEGQHTAQPLPPTAPHSLPWGPPRDFTTTTAVKTRLMQACLPVLQRILRCSARCQTFNPNDSLLPCEEHLPSHQACRASALQASSKSQHSALGASAAGRKAVLFATQQGAFFW